MDKVPSSSQCLTCAMAAETLSGLVLLAPRLRAWRYVEMGRGDRRGGEPVSHSLKRGLWMDAVARYYSEWWFRTSRPPRL